MPQVIGALIFKKVIQLTCIFAKYVLVEIMYAQF
jgi:hypothetical protein